MVLLCGQRNLQPLFRRASLRISFAPAGLLISA